MKYEKQILAGDLELAGRIRAFVPDEIFDIHAHPYHPEHFPANAFPFLTDAGVLGCRAHADVLGRYITARKMHGLYFGLPHRQGNRDLINSWVSQEVETFASPESRALMLVSPADDPDLVATALRSGRFCGIKVYHIFAPCENTMQAPVTAYAPEWIWEILHETKGVMMLHIVRDRAIEDPDNQREIRRLAKTYPAVRLILAHVARSFNYRHARRGLHVLADLDNVVVDTSAIGEAEAFRAALKILGPRRILWGSDFPVSEMRGRCVSTGVHFFWLHPETVNPQHHSPTHQEMTLVGLESLLALQEACEDTGLTSGDVRRIFLDNALGLLQPHLPAATHSSVQDDGPSLWTHAREVISGGTGLLSKRAEMFGPEEWPAYFSRCSGCEVWDLKGRRYIDFAGGIGAVLLGYGDPDVSRAVERRISLGSYCTLVSPEEVELADKLLSLHPWARKVRYARGGGDAMSVAVRTVRAATGRSGIAFCGYHGWHDWYLAANLGDSHALDGHLLPGLSPKGVPRELKGTAVAFRYNDFPSFEEALDKLGDNLAAVVMEPMRSEAPRNNFLESVAARCRAQGGLLVIDEITSGLRYGYPGALSALAVEPDLVVYAKAISNGFPFAVVIGKGEVMRDADDSFTSSSYWTDGVGPSAALAVLNKVERLDMHDTFVRRGQMLVNGLERIASRYPSCNMHITGMPVSPVLSFKVGDDAPLVKMLFSANMLREGFLVSSVIYLMYAHEEHHIEQFLVATEKAVAEIDGIISAGDLDKYRRDGNNRLPGFFRLA